ncbi:MAG: hypothetical protein ACT4TC_21075, partial [Myxococcaceae bacterium]
MKCSLVGLCLAVLVSACGRPEAGLHVSVEGALTPAQDYDALTIEARLEQEGEAIATESFNGDSLRALPVSVNFLSGPSTPVGTSLFVTVRATLGQATVATGTAQGKIGEVESSLLLKLAREGQVRDEDLPGATPDAGAPTDPPSSSADAGTRPPPLTSAVTCDPGYADCDNDPANGCEKQLNVIPPTCEFADRLGGIIGDEGAQTTDVITGTGQKILRLETFEQHRWRRAVSAKIKLKSPPGSDYDLIVQTGACTGNTYAPQAGAGGTEELEVCKPDTIVIDDDVTYFVLVKYRSGTTCGEWKLWAEGNSAGGVC